MLKIKQALPSDASLLLALSRRAPEPDFSGLDALIAYEDSQPAGYLVSRVRLTARSVTAKGFIPHCTSAFSAEAARNGHCRRCWTLPSPALLRGKA